MTELFKIPPSWEYTGRLGRYRLYMGYQQHPSATTNETLVWLDRLTDAVDAFIANALPPGQAGKPVMACIMDDNGVMLLGYTMKGGIPMGEWVGVRVGFLLLERRYDQMESAVWETIAREDLEEYLAERKVGEWHV